jgi:acetyl esterase/lipase/lysophospholipase L1-like esterase
MEMQKTTKQPHSALVPDNHNRDYPMYDWPTRHRAILQHTAGREADVVFIGDSITHRWGGAPFDPSDTTPKTGLSAWNTYFGGWNPVNLGCGYDRTENVLWRLENGQVDGMRVRAFVLLIGTNNIGLNTPREIRDGIVAIVDQLHRRHPKAHILVLGVLPRGATPNDAGRLAAAEINLLLARLRRPYLKFADIGDVLLQRDGSIAVTTMPDYVHPTEASYRAMANAIVPLLEGWLGVANGVPVDLWPHLALTPIAETVDENLYVRNVAVSQVVPFLPPVGTGNGTAIVICPGGAYCLLDWTAHVERLARRFNPEGIAVIGVRYRTSPPATHVPGDALEDLRRAIRIVIAHADRWHIDPDRLVGLGYSAGSNLLLVHASSYDVLLNSDALHQGEARLGHMALLCLWPHDKTVSAYSIRPDAPCAFLCTTEEDPVAPPAFSQGIADALRRAGRDAEVTIFPKGDHLAFNFRENGPEVDWTPAFLAWLGRQGLR